MSLRRREFITFVCGTAAVWPLAARAQQPAVPEIGWLVNTTNRSAETSLAWFRQGLSAAGFVDGKSAVILPVFADNQLERLPALAADLVRRRVAAIVANAVVAPFAKAATSTIPIVFVSGNDPVGEGLVTNINRPGGNITGISFIAETLNPKRLELLGELIPKPATIAVLWDRNMTKLEDVETAARALDRKIIVVEAGTEREIADAFPKFVKAGAGALFVGNGGFYLSQRQQLIDLAARYGLPASYHRRELVEAGGLMSYGAGVADAYRRGGVYVGRILKGEKPSDLPVELSTRYEFVLNLATAKALKIDIPTKLLALADEVIE